MRKSEFQVLADEQRCRLEHLLLVLRMERELLGKPDGLGMAFYLRGARQSFAGRHNGPVLIEHARQCGLQTSVSATASRISGDT